MTTEPDVATVRGVRRPDVAIIDGAAARTAARLGRSTFHAPDLRLVVEVVLRGSGSEREDRVRKLDEYARAGITEYWIVDFSPEARVQIYQLVGDAYELAETVEEGQQLSAVEPFEVSFDPAELVSWRRDDP